MARSTRMVLDLALFSLTKTKPALSNMWCAAKGAIINTPAKPIVCNPIITKLENTLGSLTDTLMFKMQQFRDSMLNKEEKYLIEELEKVRNRMKSGNGGPRSICRTIKPIGSEAWHYAKVEVVPPSTIAFFNGPAGTTIEKTVGGVVNSVIKSLDIAIRGIDEAAARQQRAKEEAIKAAEAKAKAEALAKEEERKKKETEAKAKAAEKSKKESAQKAAAEKAAAEKSAAEKSKKKEDPPKKKEPPKKK